MVQPSPEQDRREVSRRVRIGIVGLAGVLLMVGLAEFVIDNVRREAALNSPDSVSAGASATANATAQSSEPLADLGVTPSSDAGAGPAVQPAVPAVPDLEPDPRLQKRMDRDPRQPRP